MPSELPNPTRREQPVDNNNPPKTPTPIPAPAVKPPPAAIQTPNLPNTNNSKLVLWLIVGLLVIISAVAGIYWYLSKQQAAKPQTPQSSSQKTVVSENLDQDLNSIDIQALDNDFKAIDADLESL